MDWVFRDPLRGLSIDRFPYEKGKDEIEIDFMFKTVLYLVKIMVEACLLAFIQSMEFLG